MTSQGGYLALVLAVALERLFEVGLSWRHLRKLRARGEVSLAPSHFRTMALLHGLFLASCAVEVPLLGRVFPGALGWIALSVVLVSQVLRYWVVATLGDRWTLPIAVPRGSEPITAGPYRFVRHPNYVAVGLEFAFLPLVHGAWLTALVFSVLNACHLRRRIVVEEAAQGEAYARSFAGKPRFLPALGRRP
jgi:methyltransferase